MSKICQHCKSEFKPLRSDAKFCSVRCRVASGRLKDKTVTDSKELAKRNRPITSIDFLALSKNSDARIAVACDFTGFPNLALMKLAAHHQKLGHAVEIYNPNNTYDQVYASKVFTDSDEILFLPETTIKGGTGYGLNNWLPDEIEHICPDYDLFQVSKGRKKIQSPMDFSLGFLTRGCPRKCKFCFVPEKEGGIVPHADVKEFLRHDKVVLMDNNPLADTSGHFVKQVEIMSKLGVSVDFNQGLDARLIDDSMAKLLGTLRWSDYVRLACDHESQMQAVEKAVKFLRLHNVKPASIFCYVLIDDVDDALDRLNFLKSLYVKPYAQILKTAENKPATRMQMNLQKWANSFGGHFKSMPFHEFLKLPEIARLSSVPKVKQRKRLKQEPERFEQLIFQV